MTPFNQSPHGCSPLFIINFPSNIISNISLWHGGRVLLVLTLSVVNTLILKKPQYAGESYIYSLYSAAATALSIFFNSSYHGGGRRCHSHPVGVSHNRHGDRQCLHLSFNPRHGNSKPP